VSIPSSLEVRRPRFEGADGRDVVGASWLDVASVGVPPGSNVLSVSAVLSVSTTSVRRSAVPVVGEANCRIARVVDSGPRSQLPCVVGC
jgi:hypothetical protein